MAKPKKAAERSTHSKKTQIITFSSELKPAEFPVLKRASDLVINDATFESQSEHTLPDDHHVSFESLTHLFCRDDVVLHRRVHFNMDSTTSLSPDQWEVSPNNVDLGGCSLDNPMDVLSVHQEEPSLLEDDGPMDLSIGGADEVTEPSHVGFISEINDSSEYMLYGSHVVMEDDNRGMGSLLQADRVVEKVAINYANKATQVDIQRLKVTEIRLFSV